MIQSHSITRKIIQKIEKYIAYERGMNKTEIVAKYLLITTENKCNPTLCRQNSPNDSVNTMITDKRFTTLGDYEFAN